VAVDVKSQDAGAVLKRYKRAFRESDEEHRRVVNEAAEYYRAYGLDSIQGKDFAYLAKVWGDHPPEIGMVLSAVNDFWGQLTTSRRVPAFPGFDMSPEDEILGKAMDLLIDAGRRWAHSGDAEEQSLMDLLLMGLGFGEDALETRSRPPFRPLDRYVPISEVWWDVNANLKGLRDAQYFIHRQRYGVDEAAARYSDHADRIRALGFREGAGSSPGAGAVEGAQALGGRNTSVRLYGPDGTPIASGSGSQWNREIPVDLFQYLHFEPLVAWNGNEVGEKDFEIAMSMAQEEAIQRGMPFEKPQVDRYAQGTWYRCELLAETVGGEPLELTPPTPIPGNQPLLKVLTGFPQRYKASESDRIRTRWFGFGKVLLGLQRLSSVTVRVGIEQEARRNRAGGAIEEGAFAENQSALAGFVEGTAVPGSFPIIPDGSWEKIHFNEAAAGSHVPAMQQMFQFLSVDLPAYMLGRSDMTRGTFPGDRSTKFITTMQSTANQMQQVMTSSFTAYLEKGAITMLRLMLDALDVQDLDRLLGRQRLWEGVTGQRDPRTGQMVPMPVLGPDGQPAIDPATGEPMTMTIGRLLKEKVGEIFDNDITFGLRPSAASQRMADQELLSQHGVIGDLLKVAPPEIIVPAYLKTFAEGAPLFEAAADIDAYYEGEKAKREAAEQAQTEQGVVQFFQQLAQTDFDKALSLIQQASHAVTGPQQGGGEQQQIQ